MVVHLVKSWEDQERVPAGEPGAGEFGSGGGGKWPSTQAEMDQHLQDPKDYTKTKSGDPITPDTKLIVFSGAEKGDVADWSKNGYDPSTKPVSLAQQRYEAGEHATFQPGAGLAGGLYVTSHPYEASGFGHDMVAVQIRAGDLKEAPESTNPREGFDKVLSDLKSAGAGARIDQVVPASDIRGFGTRPGFMPKPEIGELRKRLHLVKDWEDQPRNERGEWSTEGGGSAAQAATEAWREASSGDKEPGTATIEEASRNLAESAQAFRDAGGTVETIGRDQSRATEAELDSLLKGLIGANGGNELSDRVMSGFRVAFSAASSARASDVATVRVARTADGHIAAVCSTTPRPTTDPSFIEFGLLGSTGITKGAGSALTEEVMKEAASQGLPVRLEALDTDAEHFWQGRMGASISSITPGHGGAGLSWTPGEVRQLAQAA